MVEVADGSGEKWNYLSNEKCEMRNAFARKKKQLIDKVEEKD